MIDPMIEKEICQASRGGGVRKENMMGKNIFRFVATFLKKSFFWSSEEEKTENCLISCLGYSWPTSAQTEMWSIL